MSLRSRILILLALCVPSLIFWAFCFPGWFQADHQAVVARIVAGDFGDGNHSLIWGLVAYPLMYLTPSYGFYGLFQLAAFVACMYWCILELHRFGVADGGAIALACGIGLWPTYVLYNDLYGTDVLFAYLVATISVTVFSIARLGRERLEDWRFVVWLGIQLLLLSLFRKYGIVIAALVAIWFWSMRRGVTARCWWVPIASVVCALAVSVASVQAGAKTRGSQEVLSVPTMQVSLTFLEDGPMPEEARQYLLTLHSEEEWRLAYTHEGYGQSADAAKEGVSLTPDFLRSWWQVGTENPGIYLRAFLNLESPFFDPTHRMEAGLLMVDFNNHDVVTTDYIGKSIAAENERTERYLAQFDGANTERQDLVVSGLRTLLNGSSALAAISCFLLFNRGLPLWITLGLIVYGGVTGRQGVAAMCVPSLVVELLLVLLSPVPLFRYAVEVYYAIPFIVLLAARTPIICCQEGYEAN